MSERGGSNSQPLDPEFDTLDRSATDPKICIPFFFSWEFLCENNRLKRRMVYHLFNNFDLLLLSPCFSENSVVDEAITSPNMCLFRAENLCGFEQWYRTEVLDHDFKSIYLKNRMSVCIEHFPKKRCEISG